LDLFTFIDGAVLDARISDAPRVHAAIKADGNLEDHDVGLHYALLALVPILDGEIRALAESSGLMYLCGKIIFL
jgi:hypothetical protein